MTILPHEPPALDLRDLAASYGERAVLSGISVAAQAGRLTAIVGPNGAGKSTLLRAAVGLVPATGTARFFGRPFDAARDLVAYVPQRQSVDWSFPASVLDVAAMGLYRRIGWFRPVTRRWKAQALEALERVGLADLADRPIGQLSGGQQQRVFLARALAQGARVLLLDEPLAAIDAASARALTALFRSLADEGRAIVMVHHDLSMILHAFDDAILLADGRLAGSGPASQVLSSPALAAAYGETLPLPARRGAA